MKNLKNLSNKLSLDSSVFLSYYLGEELGDKAKFLLFQESTREFYISLNGLNEIFYILCRKLDFNTAKTKIETLLNANIVQVAVSRDLIPFTGKYKCERAISLSDSFVIGLAKYTGGAALFAKKEGEIKRELTRKPFDVPILFLEEIDFQNKS